MNIGENYFNTSNVKVQLIGIKISFVGIFNFNTSNVKVQPYSFNVFKC